MIFHHINKMSRPRTAAFLVLGAAVGIIIGLSAALCFAYVQIYKNPLTPTDQITPITLPLLLEIALSDTIKVTAIDVIVLCVACMTISYALILPKRVV